MSHIAIRAENISKKYNLGTIGSGTLFRDLNMYWAKMRGRANPYARLDEKGEFNESEHWALQDVSFEIKQGEAVGIIGKNGAGKSTLLKILSRVTTPTTGQIKIRGRVASLLEVGTGFHPEMTGRENIFLNGAILGMTKTEIKKKFDEIVDFAGVEKYIDTPVKRYSSGMYVRLAFAVAAHLEPEILIVDEVLAVGDAEFQKKCLGKMNDVSQKEGRTVLFVSHQMGAVRDLCKSVIYLKGGLVKQIGEANEIIKNYLEDNINKNTDAIINRKDRSGNGTVLIEDVIIYDNATMKKIDTIICGEDVVFEFKYRNVSFQGKELNNVTFGFAIFTRDEQFLTPLNNGMAFEPFNHLPLNGSVFCTVLKFPLMHGGFIADVGLMIDNELADQVNKACKFSVENGDFFNTGNPNAHQRQGVYINQGWEKTNRLK